MTDRFSMKVLQNLQGAHTLIIVLIGLMAIQPRFEERLIVRPSHTIIIVSKKS